VSFGASVGVSGKSGDKKDAKVSGSIEVKGSQTNEMVVTHQLNEAELADYTRLLESASKGTQVADARKEFAIIAAGANPKMGWEIARRIYEGKSTKDVADGLKRKGDSAELSKERTGSIDAKGGYGPVKGGV